MWPSDAESTCGFAQTASSFDLTSTQGGGKAGRGAVGEYGTRTDCGLDCADARTVFSWLAVGH